MIKKLGKFLFGWVAVVWNWLKDLVDPELNSEFFDKIDRDYFPGQ